MRQQPKFLFSFALGLAGVVMLFAPLAWLLWRESVVAEETQVGRMAEVLGVRTERLIVEAIDLLDSLNAGDTQPCSSSHIQAMHDAAVGQPHIRAVGYWRAADRLCGSGYIQTSELRPPKADRIYPSGVIAWWPSAHTALGGVPMFLIRLGEHDLAIDPRMLLDAGPLGDRKAALWVEHLQMAVDPPGAFLPNPESLSPGLNVDAEAGRVISRFSLGTVFPIAIVVSEPLGQFWQRYWTELVVFAGAGLVLIIAWIVLVLRYSRQRFSLGAELRDGLTKDRIQVRYQPIVELGSGRCVGAETLARWVRYDGSLVSPEVFIPVAEEAGLMGHLTRAVLRRTLAELAPLLRAHPEVSLNLNLVAEDLEDSHFETALKGSLDALSVAPQSIKLEITERALVNSEAVRSRIHDWRSRGHQVAIDDFGTGYSSLSYLESLDVDILKIDKSFVDAIGTEAVTSNVIGHVIEMAKSLGLDTVAEGIEDAHQAHWLHGQGVRFGQGFLYSKPLTARQFTRYLEAAGSANVVPLDAARANRKTH